jgi:transporter family-2 protein
MNIVYCLFVFIAGIGMSFQAAVNNQLAQGAAGNSLLAACISFVIGSIFLTCIVLFTSGSTHVFSGLAGQPLWRFTGGFLGALGVFSMVFFMPRIGLANVLTLMIAGQLIAAIFIDHFGLVGSLIHRVSAIKMIGIIILLLGANLVIFGDRWLAYLKLKM